MSRPIFETNGKLGDWLDANDITVVDPPQNIFSYDPDADGAQGVSSHPLREVVDFIATHIASLPLKVYRRLSDGGRERVRDGDIARLLSNPSGNPAIPPYNFWLSLILDGLLADRYLAVIEMPQGTRDMRLKRIPPKRWSPRSDSYDEIIGAKIQTQSGAVNFDIHTDAILMGVGYAYSGAKGSPKRQRLHDILAEYEASVDYRRNVNRRGIQAPLVIQRDKPWPSVDAQNRFTNSMRAFVSGGSQVGGGIVLEDGMTANQLQSFKPIDVADLDARDKVKIDVANAYGIPPELLGIREGNFSNLAAFRQMLYGTYLDPYIVSFEQALNMCLRDRLQTYDKGLYIEFDRDGQLRGDPIAQYQALSTATGRPFLTTNEAREYLNKPNLPDGDKLVTPLNVLVGGQTSPQDGQTESRGNLPADTEEGGGQ